MRETTRAAAQMPDASYYRLLAKQCFDKALSANDQSERMHWQQRGREYAELAIAMDAENGKGADPPSKLTTEK